jgi:CO/xanthine dehydrogenase FAD-binding subunit
MRVEPPTISPASLSEAYAALARPGARALAGATDLLVQMTAEVGDRPEQLVDLWGLDALRGISVSDGVLHVGALTTFAEIGQSVLCRAQVPSLVEAAATIGAIQIQNRATIGGNAMNASPAGDSLPVLLAVDAEMVIGGATGERLVRAAEFWTGYRTTVVSPDELLLGVRIPIAPARRERFRKVGTRRAQAISKVVLAAAWTQPEPGTGWRNVRIAFGSVAATPVRATATEAALEGLVPDRAAAERAVDTLGAELHPIDDVRSTAAYRREVARRILFRILREETGW